MARHRILVSVENSPYFAWQSKLFYYSCVTRMQVQPIFLVHDTGRNWEPEFYELARFGATVKIVPSYILGDCLCRNIPGALLEAANFCAGDEFIVLCDPDMLFVRGVKFSGVLAGNFYSYVNFHQAFVETAAAKLGLQKQLRSRKDPELCCGPPYVIPTHMARCLAEAWLRSVDAFPQRTFREMWTDIMYAFGLAMLELGLKVRLFQKVDTNTWPRQRLSHSIVHYCDTNDGWNKRDFLHRHQVAQVWQPAFEAGKGTVLEEIFRQIKQAKAFYEDPVRLSKAG